MLKKEQPILFNGEMVRAILKEQKTQTRRVIKPPPQAPRLDTSAMPPTWWDEYREMVCPYGVPGDRLWVRETFCLHSAYDPFAPSQVDSGAAVLYRADGSKRLNGPENWGRTRPSIHMPRWASRLTLEITGVRVEQVQDISFDDAIAEGCNNFHAEIHPRTDARGALLKSGLIGPVAWFATLWDSINAKRGFDWHVNPWVWVVEFQIQDP